MKRAETVLDWVVRLSVVKEDSKPCRFVVSSENKLSKVPMLSKHFYSLWCTERHVRVNLAYDTKKHHVMTPILQIIAKDFMSNYSVLQVS